MKRRGFLAGVTALFAARPASGNLQANHRRPVVEYIEPLDIYPGKIWHLAETDYNGAIERARDAIVRVTAIPQPFLRPATEVRYASGDVMCYESDQDGEA